MTRRRRPPRYFRWWITVGVAFIAVGGVGIGYLTTSHVAGKGHFPVAGNSPISASPPDTHTLEPPSATSTTPSPSRTSATPRRASVTKSATARPAPKPRRTSSGTTGRSPSSSSPRPVWTPAPTPSSSRPPTTPPPTMTADPTQHLGDLIGLPRYTGMDAYAQGLADRGVVSAGPYVQGASAHGTASEAYAAVKPSLYGYTKAGIGYHDGFWVVVLSY